MSRLLLVLVSCAGLLGLVTTACSSSADGDAVAAAELQPIVDAWGERLNISALSATVMSPDGSATSVGYSSAGEPPDESSQFLVGSIGKTMLAATTLVLVEDGVLDLDEPIERWLPGFPRGDEITLRLLLSHRAGLARNDLWDQIDIGPAGLGQLEQTKTPAELLIIAEAAVGDQTLPAPFIYSAPSYFTVGAVIEAVTGQSLADVMRTRIFEPLDMADTSLASSADLDRLVPGELTLPDRMVVPLGAEAARGTMSLGWAAGGQVSTTRDLATFYGALFDDLLTPASMEEMTTPLPGSGDYGLGIEARRWPGGTSGWGHLGGIPGYICGAGVTGDGWSAAVCTNYFPVELVFRLQDWGSNELLGELLAQASSET